MVRFTLSFFTLTIRGEDALFGSAVGKRAKLELPNGEVRNLTLTDGQATVRSLPRGTYRITVEDGVYRLPPAARARALAGRRGAGCDTARSHRRRWRRAGARDRARAGRPPVPRKAHGGSHRGARARAESAGGAIVKRLLTVLVLVITSLGAGASPPARASIAQPPVPRRCSPTTTSGSRRPHGTARSAISRFWDVIRATTRR